MKYLNTFPSVVHVVFDVHYRGENIQKKKKKRKKREGPLFSILPSSYYYFSVLIAICRLFTVAFPFFSLDLSTCVLISFVRAVLTFYLQLYDMIALVYVHPKERPSSMHLLATEIVLIQ